MARLQQPKSQLYHPKQEHKKVAATPAQKEPRKGKGKGKAKANAGTDSLKDGIKALGGDDKDYELLKDVDSEVEVEAGPSSGKKDAALSKDIAKFMKGLNFATVQPEDAQEDEDEVEEDGEEGEEEEGGEDEEDGEDIEESTHEENEGTTEEPTKHATLQPKSGLLFEPTPQWYTALPLLHTQKSSSQPNAQTLASLQERAKSLHATEISQYEKSNSANKLTASSSDAAFLQRVLSSGTLSDRLSALTLLAQSSPVHNTRALETLKGMGQKKGREESLKALRAIVDWWVGGGAPNRKLKYFIDQPLTHPKVTDAHLIVWYFEDWLKKYFYSILQTLETLSLDPLPYIRMQTMSQILTLLKDKPEQEQNLLRLLVNKLGDSEKPVASRASYHILQLLQSHPSMKAVIVREMASLVLKPIRSSVAGTSKDKNAKPVEKKDLQQNHCRYYAAITCNQIMLNPTVADRDVANQLINLYFELFKEVLGQGMHIPDNDAGEEVNNAQADVAQAERGRYAKAKGKKGNGKGKGEGKDLKPEGFAEVEDGNSRFISAILTGVNRALPFAKLGLENVEFTRHVDTLFLITHTSTFNISVQALRLILQICESFISSASQTASSSSVSTSIIDRYYRTLYNSLQDSRLATSSKQAMYLNLLLKSMKVDRNIDRVKAFVRRFVQLLVSGGSGGVEFVAGGLYLLGELRKSVPDLRLMFDPNRPAKGRKAEKSDKQAEIPEYDPKKREPQFANAGASPLWEIVPLLSHYHPTVQLHASQLLSGQDLTADADLSLNTLSHFLDLFVYKNPKKAKPKGTSAMQPSAAPTDGTALHLVKGAQGGKDGQSNLNDAVFWSKDVRKVPVDQVFFHKYFNQRNEKEKAKAEKVAKRKGTGDDASEDGGVGGDGKRPSEEDENVSDGDEDEDEEEAEIWKAIKATNPDLHEGGDESDLDPELGGDSGSSIDSEEDWTDEDGDQDGEGHAGMPGEDLDLGADDDDDGDDGLSLAEGSDEDDLIAIDEEMPEGLLEYRSSGDEDGEGGGEGEWSGIGGDSKKKRKGGKQKDERQSKKKKLRSLPTFATYDDYAKMIEDGPEDDI